MCMINICKHVIQSGGALRQNSIHEENEKDEKFMPIDVHSASDVESHW